MNSGRLSYYITVVRYAKTDDGMGGDTSTRTVLFNAYADIYIPRTKDGFIGGKDIEIATHTVTIRTPDTQVKQGDIVEWITPYGTTKLVVRGIRPKFREGAVQLDCKEYGN